MPSLASRLEEALPAPTQRTRMGNGKATLLGAQDQRGTYVRRLREVMAEMVADLGGAAGTTAAQRSLVRRAAVLQIELEKLETRFAEDPSVGERTLDLYARTAGNLRRVLETLGIKPISQPPITIDAYLKTKAGP